MVKQNGVSYEHPEYCQYKDKWQRCRDVMSGQDAVHGAGAKYLPKLSEQSATEYKAYVTRAGFYNASWRSVAGFKGMIFRKPPVMEYPAGIEPHLKDINLTGLTFAQLVEDVVCDVLEVGRCGLLADYPELPEGEAELTVAQAEELGRRPSIAFYTAETIINWRYRRIANANVLALVVLREQFEIEDKFSSSYETRYRVLDLDDAGLYRVRMFRINKRGDDEQLGSDILPLMNGDRLAYIPFCIINTDGIGAGVYDPPLIDLVNTNLAHYRVSADYEHGCHFTALPTPWIAGFTGSNDPTGKPAKMYIGSQSAWTFENSDASCGFLEFSGAGLNILRQNLDAKKQEMATLGARMLTDASQSQVETFGATAIKYTSENSILAAISINVSLGVTRTLEWFRDWSGVQGDVKFELNRQFMPVQMDAQKLAAYVGAWQSGALSEGELFTILQQGDVIASEKTLEEHQGEVDAAKLALPALDDLEDGDDEE